MSKTNEDPKAAKDSSKAVPHMSLYRKYRPADFSDVVGQEHVISVLQKSVAEGKIAHAYLFAGSRGTGKTSVARIFARALGTTQNDLYEIDAASNTSVDDIRELTEAVGTVPLESKYKVYILDEVHMLSKAAFNAFLKTLEEPPQHVIFILATTETEKLPDTIVSRCEVYDFKKPTADALKKHVLDVAKREGMKLDEAGANLVALLGDGSFRDTLSILQKVFSLGAETLEQIEEVTGAPKSAIVSDYAKGILSGDAELAYAALRKMDEKNIEPKVFADLSLARFRYVLALMVAKGEAEHLGGSISSEERASLADAAKAAGATPAKVAAVVRSVLSIYNSLGKTYIPSLPLELVISEHSR
ncbi:MAG TPA: DNA polymerase III subunit gamma/tau [Candidatus Paceibacterota bacterium]